jgi:very-short-patch-repair endonuclease
VSNKSTQIQPGFWQAVGLPSPVSEYRFYPTRRWRFDYAYPEKKIAVEIEGGAFTMGRHTRGAGFIGDMEKYNAATMLGWRILRYTPKGINFQQIRELYNV